MRLSERMGGYQVTVFTSPAPLRAGPVDVSVFVQDADTGEPAAGVGVTVRAAPRGRPDETVAPSGHDGGGDEQALPVGDFRVAGIRLVGIRGDGGWGARTRKGAV